MKEALSLLSPEVSLDTPEGRTLSSLLSSPLTCLSALRSSWTPSSHLTVHLVGSRRIETSCLQAWSTLFSLSPDLLKITLVFIGLEVITPDPSFSPPDNMELVLVPPCTYEEYALSDNFIQPSIVCAFNCGFILYSRSVLLNYLLYRIIMIIFQLDLLPAPHGERGWRGPAGLH